MVLKFISDYKKDDLLRKSFNILSQSTFGIDFEEWYQKNLWNDSYICYSYKDNDKVIANVSVSKVKFIINGKIQTALQIGTVMTSKEYRGKGHSKSLLNKILEKYEEEYDIIFLFANENVLEFYPKFGFEKKKQYKLYLNDEVKITNDIEFIKLSMDNESDINIIKLLSKNRKSLSNNFDVIHSESILYWYCLNVFRNDIYYHNKYELIIIYQIEGNTLNIFDIISNNKMNISNIIANIKNDDIKEVVFHFDLECNSLDLIKKEFDDTNDTLFIKSKYDINYKIVYPTISHA